MNGNRPYWNKIILIILYFVWYSLWISCQFNDNITRSRSTVDACIAYNADYPNIYYIKLDLYEISINVLL